MSGLRARLTRLRRDRRDDSGFTLTELMVSMAVLGVVMLLVTGAILLASGTAARVDAANASQLQANSAFTKLDRQVRWAAGFSRPGTVGGNQYAEWLYTAGGTPTCFELELDNTGRKLQKRSWTQGDLTTRTPWQVIASGVTSVDAATPPFTLLAANATYPMARLRIAVTANAGGVKARDTSTHDVTYAALNSTGGTVAGSVCTEGRTA